MQLATPTFNKDVIDITNFIDWIIDIENSKQSSNECGENIIHIPEDLLGINSQNTLMSLVEITYSLFFIKYEQL